MPETNTVKTGDMEKAVMEKIQAANSILILMKKKPSVDEMATAVGLEIVLDEMGKRATVLYPGEVPGEIKFLNPEKSFAKNTEVLQDFIVSFKQIMADHLRYEIVGDEVKIFISPYRQKITKEDLGFSYGEAMVDLVVQLNIQKVAELERTGIEQILNKAEIVEIATGEIERTGRSQWVNPKVSSVAEMVAGMVEKMPEAKIRREAANAFLAGIVVETEKFMNQKTTSETMGVAQKLMQAGANPTEIAAQIEKGREEAKNGAVASGVAEGAGAKVTEVVTAGTVASGAAEPGTKISEVIPEVKIPGVTPGIDSQVTDTTKVSEAVPGVQAPEMEIPGVAAPKMAEVAPEAAKANEKEVRIPEEKIEELGRVAEEMRTEKVEEEVKAKLDEMAAPKVAPIEDYQAKDVLGEGAAKSVEKIRSAAVYPGAELDDYVEVQPQAWQTKDYAAMMEKELSEPVGVNPAVEAANSVAPAEVAAENVPAMDYTVTAGVEKAPGFNAEMAGGAETSELAPIEPALKAEPMRKIERPEAVAQTMTEAQLKQPWEIGMGTTGAKTDSSESIGVDSADAKVGEQSGEEMGKLSPVDGLPMPVDTEASVNPGTLTISEALAAPVETPATPATPEVPVTPAANDGNSEGNTGDVGAFHIPGM